MLFHHLDFSLPYDSPMFTSHNPKMVCKYLSHPLASFRRSPVLLRYPIRNPKPSISNPTRFASASPIKSFQWDDALTIAEDSHRDGDSSDLSGYFQKVRDCNRGSELKAEFVPFVVEDQIVGYIHNGFINYLRKFEDIFNVVLSRNGTLIGGHVTLHSSLKTPEKRTEAVGDVIKQLGNLIPGIRNELYPVTSSFGMPTLLSLERAAAPYFGIKAYGVHMNGYVDRNGRKFLWIGKRSNMKPTYPGMLDHLAAGGLPHGISCKENLVKECEEEAGIPGTISASAIPVGAISYVDIDGFRYKRDVLFCYDLKLPADFFPKNEVTCSTSPILLRYPPQYVYCIDGEVDSFRLVPLTHVANIIRRTEFFKPNCCLVIIDFLFRHGYISPDDCGYLELLQSLRGGNCS